MPAERWRSEEFLARPGRTIGWVGALLVLVILLALLIPAGPLAGRPPLGRADAGHRDAVPHARRARAPTPSAAVSGAPSRWPGSGSRSSSRAVGRRWRAFALAEALTPLARQPDQGWPSAGSARRVQMLEAHGTSFPSGHAAYAGATAVALVLLFSRPGRGRATLVRGRSRRDRRRWPGAARYLQVHWLSDALAGAALGVADRPCSASGPPN